mmetsp:Transcript_19307/g.54562  ORF Transcript_19307/g.54562 Transcript_19307/m.54562 type:complete len:267 (-) Transcript_19307:3-803(-)
MSSGVCSTLIFLVIVVQNSSKSISPLPSRSISLIIVSSSLWSSRKPTVSSSCSSSSTDIAPSSSHATMSASTCSPGSAFRDPDSCLKRQKICRNSSFSSDDRPCCFATSTFGHTSFFLGGSFSAAFRALSNSLTLTSPPPSLSMRAMRQEKSWSEALKPSSASASRSSEPETAPSPLASILLKRSTTLSFFFFSLSTRPRRMSSAFSDMQKVPSCAGAGAGFLVALKEPTTSVAAATSAFIMAAADPRAGGKGGTRPRLAGTRGAA